MNCPSQKSFPIEDISSVPDSELQDWQLALRRVAQALPAGKFAITITHETHCGYWHEPEDDCDCEYIVSAASRIN